MIVFASYKSSAIAELFKYFRGARHGHPSIALWGRLCLKLGVWSVYSVVHASVISEA